MYGFIHPDRKTWPPRHSPIERSDRDQSRIKATNDLSEAELKAMFSDPRISSEGQTESKNCTGLRVDRTGPRRERRGRRMNNSNRYWWLQRSYVSFESIDCCEP